MLRLIKFFIKFSIFCLFWAFVAGGALFVYAYATYGRDLPTVSFMKDYSPATVSRVHAADGQLLAEYSVERRLFVPIESIPKHVRAAFLSAEDKSFYYHGGLDYISMAGAVINNFHRYRSGRRLVGASTITQQVAKNFITGDQRSVERKIREAFIAWRLEAEFSKDEILELYLNEVEFGQGAFGIASAALTYFNKSLKDLAIGEAAYLAATLKAPNNYHPTRNAEAARERRDWVLKQMYQNGYINLKTMQLESAEPVTPDWSYRTKRIRVSYFSDEVKRQLDRDYGRQFVLREGLSVRTTLNPEIQQMAERALHDGLRDYDRRHGWRGPLGRIATDADDWAAKLEKFATRGGLQDWRVALVYDVSDEEAKIAFPDATGGFIKLQDLKWAREHLKGQRRGRSIRRVQDVLSVGDVVAVSRKSMRHATWGLEQIPDVQGAVVVMNPHNGRVQALVGGYDYKLSQFNRATQSLRQPGSTFKPFVYLAALDSGKTPESPVLDSPVVVRMVDGELYKPRNSDGRFLGVQPLRTGLEKSRNLMTLRLAQEIGMKKIVEYARLFGIDDNLKPYLSTAIGSGGTSLLKMTGAYAMLANGGYKVYPTLVDRVQDRKGRTVKRLETSSCDICQSAELMARERLPVLTDKRKQVANPVSIYHVVSMMQGVIQRGTARAIGRTIDRPVAGKTGTTNDNQDAWFIGFTPDVVIGVWVGFDQPKTLGKDEYGGRAAAPIFRDLLNEMLLDEPARAFRVPEGIKYKHIDPITGSIKIAKNKKENDEPLNEQSLYQQNRVDGAGQPFDPYAVSSVRSDRASSAIISDSGYFSSYNEGNSTGAGGDFPDTGGYFTEPQSAPFYGEGFVPAPVQIQRPNEVREETSSELGSIY